MNVFPQYLSSLETALREKKAKLGFISDPPKRELISFRLISVMASLLESPDDQKFVESKQNC